MENRLKIGISHGDVNGISYELIIKMTAENRICEICTPILYGSSKVAAYHRKTLNIENFNLNSIQIPQEANAKRCNVINCVDDAVKVELGKETQEGDEVAMIALKEALDALDQHTIDAVVAAPQNVKSFGLENASGCPAFLAARYGVKDTMPLLVGAKMKIGFVTTHIPFKEITPHITAEHIGKKLKMLDNCLKKDFTIRKPRIAVLGLNPHTGENCTFGEEEQNIILPALERARENGIMALGPYAADNLFSGMEFEKFDAILALYHDQGMIPFKAIEGYEGAVLMTGLPVVYTSTVTGTAYDIVGKGEADESALRNALYLAIDVYNNRLQNEELATNPLQHYDVAGNANESDMNVEQIAGVKEEIED